MNNGHGPFPPGIAPPQWGVGQGGRPVITPPSSLGPGGRPEVTQLTQQIYLPDVFPIPDAKEFNPLGSATSAGLETNTVIAGTVFTVPDSTMGIIRGVTLYITNMLTTTNVVWSLLIDGQPAQGFNQLTIFPRAAPFVSNSLDAAVRFNGPATIQFVFSNLDGGAYTVGASFSGWFWPTASNARWLRFGPH